MPTVDTLPYTYLINFTTEFSLFLNASHASIVHSIKEITIFDHVS